ncbi:alkaline phosphatase [Aureimonas sp. SA4125]|uniref:PAS domain-containing sensor histidine kinase n=1 Tax=Aureimonas sp. SA4125 TaxID=2826993 RepID=UPI001CC4E540|nr:PAS domain-containing sensor histidine kinase [Aureimonas sp. SA4125]BDA87028.1 alkaline phosphatase [Aureimonas sp. SA4125]
MPSMMQTWRADRIERSGRHGPWALRRASGPAWRRWVCGSISSAILALPAGPARAQSIEQHLGIDIPADDILYLALFALVVGVAMLAVVWLIQQRARTEEENEQLRAELAESRFEAEKRGALLSGDDHQVVVYSGERVVDILGTLPSATGAPADPRRFLDFNEWLPRPAAARLEGLIDRLKTHAEGFALTIDHLDGQPIEVAGRTVGALATVRFSPLSGLREELTRLKREHASLLETVETLQSLCDALTMPVWLRDRAGRLVWVNRAYAAAVDGNGVADAVARQLEFLGQQDRTAIALALETKRVFVDRLTTVVDADRRSFSVIDAAGPLGSAGLAVDVSEAEAVRQELSQTVKSHSETLDHLTTAVARFDEKTQLNYYNAAFQRLFSLTSAYLDSSPDHVAMMDQLRSRGTLPEDRSLRDLKHEIIAAYRATEPTELMWHLADGRTLRIFVSPAPQGGATWVFEDLTEKLELESRLKALVQLQGETLDYLSEAVAVFGQDGRLRLSNPAFGEMWGLSEEFLAAKPHVNTLGRTVAVSISPPEDDRPPVDWPFFCQAVTAFDEGAREATSGEFALADGRIASYGIVPLPNGQSMLTFSDISDARRAELMLRERNEALEVADRIKTDFVKHVNYELRSPLTNIIGFSALLRSTETGPLTERQSEYLDYISISTSSLMTIVNDILDLASIDAGTMDLEMSDVDIAETVNKAAEAVRDRLKENDIGIDIDVSEAGESFRADEHRVTQILFNLLSNAANFAPAGSTIAVKAVRKRGEVAFLVHDEGPGIAPDQIARVFERFESDPVGGRNSGAGLGLSIVKSFLDLHKGSIAIDSSKGGGTTVICRFPAGDRTLGEAAE